MEDVSSLQPIHPENSQAPVSAIAQAAMAATISRPRPNLISAAKSLGRSSACASAPYLIRGCHD